MANTIDLDQTPRTAVSDLGVTVCKGLSVPILRVINYFITSNKHSLKMSKTCLTDILILWALLDEHTTNRVLKFLSTLLSPYFFIIVRFVVQMVECRAEKLTVYFKSYLSSFIYLPKCPGATCEVFCTFVISFLFFV